MKRNRLNNTQAEEVNSASWLTTFNDLVTLLMVFFVLMFSLSSIDVKKMSDFQYALQSGLGVLREGQQSSIAVQDDQAVKDMSNIHTQADGRGGEPRQKSMQPSLEEALNALGDDIGFRVTYSEQGAHLSFKDGVLFGFGQAAISAEGFVVLNKIADVIRKMPYPIRVEGHTDNVPIHTKRFPSNWELSTVRAVNVLKYFADEGRIDPRRLSAVGYGESKPLVNNDSPRNRAKNRRVEIVLIKEDLR
jgi:chemotaxis protein MotB